MVEPVGRGLQFAGMLSGGTLFKADFGAALQTAGVNATAYAADVSAGQRSVVILNKDLEKDLDVTLAFAAARNGAVDVQWLRAPAIDSRETHITQPSQAHATSDGRYRLVVPHASGVRVTIG